jgi:polysaccharide export outer membrane protein
MEKHKVLWGMAVALLAWPAVAQPVNPPAGVVRSSYVLGPDDVISIRASDADEISDKSIRIAPNGSINLPLVGRMQAGGRTAEELQQDLVSKLKPFIRNPEVSVNVVELRSQPISIIGSVTSPGVLQLQGRKTLVEVLAMAGGVREEAGYRVKITRQKEWGPIPLADAVPDPSGQFTVAEVNLKGIMEAKFPVENILVMPNDVISVPRAEMVYVVGEVKKAGGFILGEQAHVSVLKALSMASGLEKTAAPSKARILRATATQDTKRTEIAINLKNILSGKDKDVPMEPDDILFVPSNQTRSAAIRVAEAALQIGSGIAIYRSY